MQQVQRQIILPISKAIEIAYKNIRLRLSRSLLVTSGIVLALAFLMSILSGDALVDSMRRWALSAGEGSTRFKELSGQRDALAAKVQAAENDLRAAVQGGA